MSFKKLLTLLLLVTIRATYGNSNKLTTKEISQAQYYFMRGYLSKLDKDVVNTAFFMGQALKIDKNSIILRNELVESYLSMAQVYLYADDFQAAVILYEDILEIDPNSVEAASLLAAVKDKYRTAIYIIEDFIKRKEYKKIFNITLPLLKICEANDICFRIASNYHLLASVHVGINLELMRKGLMQALYLNRNGNSHDNDLYTYIIALIYFKQGKYEIANSTLSYIRNLNDVLFKDMYRDLQLEINSLWAP